MALAPGGKAQYASECVPAHAAAFAQSQSFVHFVIASPISFGRSDPATESGLPRNLAVARKDEWRFSYLMRVWHKARMTAFAPSVLAFLQVFWGRDVFPFRTVFHVFHPVGIGGAKLACTLWLLWPDCAKNKP
jgi:hypothetical protein